jgi:hypothetical protein
LTYTVRMTVDATTQPDERDRAPVCNRCHGTGAEPGYSHLTAPQLRMLARIRDVGQEIRAVSAARDPDGFEARRKAYNKLRALEPQWKKLGLSKPMVHSAAGLSRMGLHKILTHAGAV